MHMSLFITLKIHVLMKSWGFEMDDASGAGRGFDLLSREKRVDRAGQCLVLYFIFSQHRRHMRACAPQASCSINQSSPQILPKRLFCRDRQAGASAICLSAVFSPPCVDSMLTFLSVLQYSVFRST